MEAKKKKAVNIIIAAAACLVFAVSFLVMQLPGVGIAKEDMGGRNIFDSELKYYSGSYFYETLNLMQDSGIKGYIYFHIADYFFLLSYGTLMYILLRFVLTKKYKFLAFVFPIIPPLFDLLENSSIDILLSLYPTRYGYADALGVFTCIKWYSGALWVAVFAAFLAVKLIKRLKAKNEAA